MPKRAPAEWTCHTGRRFRIVPFTAIGEDRGEFAIQAWNAFDEEWRIWDAPYISFHSRADAIKHYRKVTAHDGPIPPDSWSAARRRLFEFTSLTEPED